MRTSFGLVAPLFLLAVACGDGGSAAEGNTAGTGSGTNPGTSGAPSASGGGGGAPIPSGGSSGVASGGSSPTTGGLATIPLAGSGGQAVGGGDQGTLFPPEGAVPIMPVGTGGSGGGGAGGGSAIPGDGKSVTSKLGGSIGGTAVFSQKGVDVTVVVTLTNGCADGKHMFQVYDGDSCDNPSTEGKPWAPRGTGLGPVGGIQCSGGKGMMMDMRLGADTTKNLTVGDHVLATDVSTHVVIVSDEKDPNSRASCGNFF